MTTQPGAKFDGASLADLLKSFKPRDFHFIRIVSAEDGTSRFEETSVLEGGHNAPVVWARDATAVKLSILPAGVEIPYHLTGHPMLLILLRGLAVFTCDDAAIPGQSYYPQAPGSVFWCEDLTGRGHGGKLLGREDSVVLEVRLA